MSDLLSTSTYRFFSLHISGFKTPTGTYAITGIFVLPLWFYGIQSKFLTNSVGMPLLVQYLLCVFLIGGRFLAFVTEVGEVYFSKDLQDYFTCPIVITP